MENTKEELITALDNIKDHSVSIKCAWISYKDFAGKDSKVVKLKLGFTKLELDHFMAELDFGYNNCWGNQELFGIIWFDDGSWLERGEYDGTEWWEYKRTPEIPAYLSNN